MAHPKHEFKDEQLHLLLHFINENSPIPKQDDTQTSILLERHTQALYQEINENMSQLQGLDLYGYERYVDESLYEVNIYGYQQAITHERDMPELRERYRLKKKTPEKLAKYPLSDIYEEWMGEEEKNERMEQAMALTTRFSEKLDEIGTHLKEAYEAAKKVDLLLEDPEVYISPDLERLHQQQYLEYVKILTEPERLEGHEEKLPELRLILNLWHANFKAEICNNFYRLPASVTKAYLQQLLRIFSDLTEEIGKVIHWNPVLRELQEFGLTQLEDLQQQSDQRIVHQVQKPYSVKMEEVMGDSGFSRLLTLVLIEAFEAEGFKHMSEEEQSDMAAMIVGLDSEYTREKLQLIKQPSSTWSLSEQESLKKVEEYLERLSGCQEYNYDLPEGSIK